MLQEDIMYPFNYLNQSISSTEAQYKVLLNPDISLYDDF